MWDRWAVDTLELLLHPVRMRIVHALSGSTSGDRSGGRTRTTAELCARLPDVPKTTVYRHVGLLAEGGVLEVAEEHRVRGAVERHYRLRRDRTAIGTDDAATMSLDDHRQGFAAAMAALLAEFNTYLARPGADPLADDVGYRQGIVWLNPTERAELIAAVLAALRALAGNGPDGDRVPYLMSAIFFPVEGPPGEGAVDQDG
jgi:DNA-binding transcriptional ArsR family regulator